MRLKIFPEANFILNNSSSVNFIFSEVIKSFNVLSTEQKNGFCVSIILLLR